MTTRLNYEDWKIFICSKLTLAINQILDRNYRNFSSFNKYIAFG